MRKYILLLMLTGMCLVGSMSSAYANPGIEIVENDFSQIEINIKGNTLYVSGAAGETLYIYNITGVRVTSFKVDGSDKSYNLNLSKGCYIVKVGSVVRKISIR